jgi:hypothetical protein
VSRIARGLALALLLAFAPARAQEPAMVVEGAVAHYCGGVGAEERQAMRSLEAQANLKLLFVTARRGGYLADATVAVADGGAARLFEAVAQGPICLLRLPQGRYRLTARLGDVTRSATIAVGATAGRPPQLVFAFPGEPWDGIWASPEEKQQARQ